MKNKFIFIWLAVFLVAFGLTIIAEVNLRREKRERAELHLLNTLQGGLSAFLDTGGQLPTSWMQLSNAVNSELAVEICKNNQLPPPTELYTVLQTPTNLDDYHHCVFLVRSKSARWPRQGRWVVGVGFGWTRAPNGQPLSSSSCNKLYRTWVSEDYLPANIRSQLARQ